MLMDRYRERARKIPVIYGSSDVFRWIVTGEIQKSPYYIWYTDQDIRNPEKAYA